MRAGLLLAAAALGLACGGCFSSRPARAPVAWGEEAREDLRIRSKAYFGMPKSAEGRRVPGIVLVHAAGGEASRQWALYWKRRGYAVVALVGGWRPGGFAEAGRPPAEQQVYAVVADVLRAQAVLRARPEVDPDRIGVCGAGAGGVIAVLAASADPGFAFAASVRGCGFLDDDSPWNDRFHGGAGEADWQAWCGLWDPRHHLGRVRCPVLWLGGDRDAEFPLTSAERSAALTGPRAVRVIRAHPAPADDEALARSAELAAFADGETGLGPRYPRCTGLSVRGGTARAKFRTQAREVLFASFHWTEDAGPWKNREWKDVPADFDGKFASAPLPAAAKACYFTLFFKGGLALSSNVHFVD